MPRSSSSGHAGALLERAELAEAELAAAAGRVAGRGRIASFQSVALQLAVPAMQALAREAPDLRCELDRGRARAVAARARARRRRPRPGRRVGAPAARAPAGVDRDDLHRDPVHSCCPRTTRRRGRGAVPLAELAGEAWTTGHPGTAWEEIDEARAASSAASTPTSATARTTTPPARALCAEGQAVTLLPRLGGPGEQSGSRRPRDRRGLLERKEIRSDSPPRTPRIPAVRALPTAARAAAERPLEARPGVAPSDQRQPEDEPWSGVGGHHARPAHLPERDQRPRAWTVCRTASPADNGDLSNSGPRCCFLEEADRDLPGRAGAEHTVSALAGAGDADTEREHRQ